MFSGRRTRCAAAGQQRPGLEPGRLGDLVGHRAHFLQPRPGALPGRQILQARDERQPQPLARGDDDSGIGHLAGQSSRTWQ